MTGGCLGDVAAALVDVELDDAGRERAHRHLAHCAGCRAEVDGQRRLKARMSGVGQPEPPAALTDRLLRMHLPPDERLGWDLQNFHTNKLPILQARITDLQAALGSLSSPAEQTLTLTVRDPLCSWNDGTFAVTLTPDGSTAREGRALNTPALALDIGTLTQLVAGALRPETALRSGLAEGDLAAAQALAALGGGYTTFMPSSDYF